MMLGTSDTAVMVGELNREGIKNMGKKITQQALMKTA